MKLNPKFRWQLPERIQDLLAQLPETGMGYQVVDLIMKNGTVVEQVPTNGRFIPMTYLLELEAIVDARLSTGGENDANRQ